MQGLGSGVRVLGAESGFRVLGQGLGRWARVLGIGCRFRVRISNQSRI